MNLSGKNVAVIGLGLTGQSCVHFLLQHGASVTGFDTRTNAQIDLDVKVVLGDIKEGALTDFDFILMSPGLPIDMPAIAKAKKAGIEVIGDIELFARFCQCPVIAITGSNGKSTVVDMLAHVFSASSLDVGVGGNIGKPALELLSQTYDFIVLELSSFQLETTHSLKLKIASILNVSEDHLDRHKDLASYQQAKHRIYQHAEIIIANAQDQLTHPVEKSIDYYFGNTHSAQGLSVDFEASCLLLDNETWLDATELQVAGKHNLLNAQVAAQIAMLCGVNQETVADALRRYPGLPHRCQKVANINDVQWIDDSKATNVGATLAAIEGIEEALGGDLILLAGGDSKQADLSPLKMSLQSKVRHLILLGKDAQRLASLKQPLGIVQDMDEAVSLASSVAKSGDTVLLSPACASLDMFDNFAHRGQCFQKAVGRLQ